MVFDMASRGINRLVDKGRKKGYVTTTEIVRVVPIDNLEQLDELYDLFENNYQTGVIREWINAKMDSALGQIKHLENISKLMSDGN